MGSVVKEVFVKMLSRGLNLMNDDGREWNVNQLLFVDDTALVADLEQRLRHLIEEFGRVCEGRKLRVNESKSTVMKYTRKMDDRKMNEKLLEGVECFKYLGSRIAIDGEIDQEIKLGMNEVGKVCGGMNFTWNECQCDSAWTASIGDPMTGVGKGIIYNYHDLTWANQCVVWR